MQIKDEHIMSDIGVLPVSWESKKLGDFAQIMTGSTPSTSDKENYGSEYMFVSPADLGKTKWIENSEKKLSHKGFSNARKFPAYSILYTCIGSTIGKSGMARHCLTSNQQINAILPNDKFCTDFVFYALQLISKQIKSAAGEQAVPIVNKTEFEEFRIPFPPLPEQRRIAEVLSDMDGLIGSLEKLLAKKRLIRQGMMQRLLTPQENWEVKRLGEIAEIVGRIGFRGYTRQDIVKNGYGAISLSPGNIIGNKLSLDSFTSISWKKYDESPEIKVRINDILLVKTGSTFGKTAIVEHLPQKATINPQIVIIKNSKINAKFLSLIISTKRIQDLIMATVVGGAIPTLSQEQIGNFPIYYPKEEARQKEIAASIESMNSSIGSTENLIKKYKFIKQGMIQKLLTGEIRL